MTIKCGACGQDLEIAGTIDDGQHVRCPFCGETTAYSKPSRIELPVGAARPKQPRPAQPPPEVEAAVPELPPEEARPKLHVRRPQAPDAAASGRASDVVRQVEARANAERKRARARRLRAHFNNVVALVVLAAVGFGGYKAYRVWKGDETIEIPTSVEGLVEKLKPSDAEASRKAAEDAARADEERQRELERMREREAKEAADAEKRNAEKKWLEEFFAVRNGFAGARLAYWGELPKEKRPGACEGTFGLLVPRGRGRCEYFRIDSRTDGLTVWRLSDKAPPKEIAKDEYVKVMTEHGGFFLKDGAAYFVTASGKGKITAAPSERGETFSPAKTVFGDAYPILGERLIETAGRGFDVFFAFDEKAEPVKVGSVKFDGEVGYAAFEKAARDIAAALRKKKASEPPSDSEVRRVLAAGVVTVKRK